ncbi:unnamed protein product [Closterium sp. NIES-53]
MIHVAAPHFLWPFAVRYAAHQLNLWPRVSLPETSPTLRWTGKVGDASVFRVWGSHALVCDMSADKLSARAIPCESVPFYHLFPYRSTPPPPLPLFLAPGPPPLDPLRPQGPAPSGVSHVDPLPGTVPVEVARDSGAARGAASRGAEPGGAESEGAGFGGAEPGGEEPGGAESAGVGSGGAKPEGVEPEGIEPGGAESEGAESGGAEPRGVASSGGPAGASPSLSPRPETLSLQQLREWLVWRASLQSGATGAKGTGDAGVGGAGVTAGAGGTGGTAAAGPGGAHTRETGAARTGGVGGAGAGDPTELGAAGAGGAGVGGTGASGAGAGGAGAVGAGAGGAEGTVWPRPYVSQLPLEPTSPPPAPSPYIEQTGGLTERREPASRPASPVRTGRRIPRSRPPPVSGTHAMALCSSSVPLRVPLQPPLESSLPAVPDPEVDRARAASPTVSRLLATAVTDPSFESTAASALVAELVEFAAACCLDYAITLVIESASPPFVGGECALGTDVLEDRQEDFECLATIVHHLVAMLVAPEGDSDAPEIPPLCSYAEAITGP